jgi:hypothetical protein
MRAVVLDLVSRRRHLARFVPSHADAPDSAASSR